MDNENINETNEIAKKKNNNKSLAIKFTIVGVLFLTLYIYPVTMGLFFTIGAAANYEYSTTSGNNTSLEDGISFDYTDEISYIDVGTDIDPGIYTLTNIKNADVNIQITKKDMILPKISAECVIGETDINFELIEGDKISISSSNSGDKGSLEFIKQDKPISIDEDLIIPGMYEAGVSIESGTYYIDGPSTNSIKIFKGGDFTEQETYSSNEHFTIEDGDIMMLYIMEEDNNKLVSVQ